MTWRSIYITLVLGALLAGCDNSADKKQGAPIVDVNSRLWQGGAQVTVENIDTLTPQNIDLLLRYNDTPINDTLTLRIDVTSPDSLHSVEHVKVLFTKESTSAARSNLLKVRYRSSAQLKSYGHYKFVITPTRAVEGVQSVGVILKPEQF